MFDLIQTTLQGWFSGGFNWPAFWTIVIADILLAGDNAIVIALVAKELPAHQRTKAIIWGSTAAIALRIGLTIFATTLLKLPFLKLIGGLMLVHIAVSLLTHSDDIEEGKPAASLPQAIKMILFADLAMSLDNVIAVAGAADGHFGLLILGLLISVPLIIGGSTFLVGIMDRFPIIIIAGAAMLGWLSGEMIITDLFISNQIGPIDHTIILAFKVSCAVLVVALAWWKNGKKLNWTAAH